MPNVTCTNCRRQFEVDWGEDTAEDVNHCSACRTAARLTAGQLGILHHTRHRAARKMFCGDGPDMRILVALGLMRSAGTVSWSPDEYFTITELGGVVLDRAQRLGATVG